MVAGTRDMAGSSVNRLLHALVPGCGSGVEQQHRRIVQQGGYLLCAGDGSGRPGPGHSRDRDRPPRAGLQGIGPGRDPTIEHRGRLPSDPQHPPQSGRDRACGIVVGHHGTVLGDTEAADGLGECGRIGQGMATAG